MNAVEIEEAVSELASQPFDLHEFPFQFLTAFGNKETTIRRLRSGSSNPSDIPYGVLQRNNIHVATSAAGRVRDTLAALRESPRTAKLEHIIHRVFANARLDANVTDRFDRPVQAREWFLVPLGVIDEAVDRIRDHSITDYRYDPSTASLVAVKN